jgi:hypothetical protein
MRGFMSARKIVLVTLCTVILATFATLAIYVYQFGTTLSTDQEKWAQFGDYLGGVLNPIFALFAFFGLLWSIAKQGDEFRTSLDLLRRQTQSAEDQLDAFGQERAMSDLLHVVKEIDFRIEQLLDFDVSGPIGPRVNIRQMKSEAQRLRKSPGTSKAYSDFLAIAKVPGTVVEAPVRELIYLVGKMRQFLESYGEVQKNAKSPIQSYYADKCLTLMDMLDDMGALPADTRLYFESVSSH